MKIRCLYKTGRDLRPYEYKDLGEDELGRFGATAFTEFGQLEIGKEYLVMGMIIGEGVLNYLIDDDVISACPYQLFEITDNKISSNWFFKSFKKDDEIYPYIEVIWGYYELVFDNTHYEKLIECDEETQRIYFRRKIEIERN